MLTRRVDLATLKTEAAGSQVVFHHCDVTSYAMARLKADRLWCENHAVGVD